MFLHSLLEVFADNQGAIKLVKNPVVSNRSKHIDVVYHFALQFDLAVSRPQSQG